MDKRPRMGIFASLTCAADPSTAATARRRQSSTRIPVPSSGRRRSARATVDPSGPGRRRRVVILSHGHPVESPAGGEIAAREELHAFVSEPGTEAILVAASANGLVPVGVVKPVPTGASAEYIAGFARSSSSEGEVDRLTPPQESVIDWLCTLAPDELRVHHFFRIGLETLFALRLRLPATRLVFIAHEMMTICEANGHMVKEFTGQLCHRASPIECAWCFPKRGVDYFAEREAVMRNFLELCDEIQTPSRFLRDRLAEWGVPGAKLRHVPYDLAGAPHRPWPDISTERPLTLGFIGHIAPHKGILLLLDAVAQLPEVVRDRLRLRIHGILHPNIDKAFRRNFVERVAALHDCVSYEGPYAREQLTTVLAGLDGVVVPSLWWENAPMVIVEARRDGLPVITADVGGMAELGLKTDDGIGFRFGSATGLAQAISRVVLAGTRDAPSIPATSAGSIAPSHSLPPPRKSQ